jgi:hypothetical protein
MPSGIKNAQKITRQVFMAIEIHAENISKSHEGVILTFTAQRIAPVKKSPDQQAKPIRIIFGTKIEEKYSDRI